MNESADHATTGAAGPETLPRVVPATDAVRYLATDELVWFSEPVSEPAERAAQGVPERHRFAVEVDDPLAGGYGQTYAGIYGVRPLLLSVAGGGGAVRQVPVAGLTWVGVHPDHRRRGVLRAMMRHHLERTRAERVAVSALHCSEPKIYGRYGYGIALTDSTVTLSRGTALTAPGLEQEAAGLRVRSGSLGDAGMAELLERGDRLVGATEPGTIVLEPDVYRRFTIERPEELRDKEPMRVLVAYAGDEPAGTAVYRRSHKWERGRPGGEVHVRALVGGPAARLVLLRRLVDLDLTATVKVPGIGVDDPLWHWVPGPRGVADSAPADNLWIRIVDLPAALRARGYDGSAEIVVAVTDDLLRDQAGSWLIRIGDGQAEATRSQAAPEVSLDIGALGAAWPGAANLVAMQRAGLVTEHRPGAVRELWRALRVDVAPTPSPGF